MKNKIGKLFICGGIALIAAALLLVGYNLFEGYTASRSADAIVKEIDGVLSVAEDDGAIPDYILNPQMEMPTVKINGQDCIGILEMPSLKRKLPVISSWSYPKLKSAPCRYYGSAYTNDLIIAAHNYSSHFRNLKELSVGDEVIFTDVDKNKFSYQVVETQALMPTDIEEMQSGEWDLTLFTCTPGGAYRVTVRCVLA